MRISDCKAEFDQQEENCGAAFRTLLRDSHILQRYLAEAYRLVNEMSYEAHQSFSDGNYSVQNSYAQQSHPDFQTLAPRDSGPQSP